MASYDSQKFLKICNFANNFKSLNFNAKMNIFRFMIKSIKMHRENKKF